MDKDYFSHYTGGDYNKKNSIVIGYNEFPDQAIALDPRTIINVWSEDALKSMSMREVYAGLQIYCLEDRMTRICRWVPSVGQYTANDCIWDIIHTSDEDAWVDIRSMEVENPVELLNDRIKEAELKEYQFLISANTKYWGISNNEVENDNYEQIIHDIVLRNKEPIIAGSYSNISNGEKILAFNNYKDITKSVDGKLYILVPSKERSSEGINVSSVKYSFDETIKLEFKQKLSLNVFNTVSKTLDSYLYDLYVVENEITNDIINKLINEADNTNIKVTFVKIKYGKE